MKKYISIIMFLVFCSHPLLAQSQFTSIGLNMGTNLLIGDSRVVDSKISPNIGAFVIYKYSDRLNFKIQTGYGKFGVGFSQKEFSTSFIPVELIGMLSLKNKSDLIPFVHAGLGAFGFKLNGSPTFVDGILLAGAGFSLKLNSDFTVITSTDVRYTTGDDFNGINTGLKDGYFNVQTGIAYNFNKGNKKYKKEGQPQDIIVAQQLTETIEKKPGLEQAEVKPAQENKNTDQESEQIQLAEKIAEINSIENKTLYFDGINFSFDSAELSNKAIRNLEKIIQILNTQAEIKIEIHGHTDSIGDFFYNKNLSVRRANAVKNYLVKKGISQQRLIAKGFGEENPVAVNTTKEGRAQNRRVEFVNVESSQKILTLFK